MAKAPAKGSDSALRMIPSVERILTSEAFSAVIGLWGRERVKVAVSQYLDGLRFARTAYDEREAIVTVSEMLESTLTTTLRRTINGTGVLIHTNLGRAPIDPAIWAEAAELVTSYSNLEFDVDSGDRGKRDEHLSALCRALFGCEAAVLTNNNAAGTMLMLAAVASGKDVIVSRGELVEIGGAFRVPDVIEQGGARLREVGTTNRTRAADYAEACSRRTAALLRVHRSNFDIVGFTETPSVPELVAVAKQKRVPLLYDEGAGCVVDIGRYGFAQKETIASLLASGVDAISCSTDKLIGALQGGLILGSSDIVDRCRRHPLMRALRAGKESYAVLAATLRAFATGRHEEQIALYRMLATPLEELRDRASRIINMSSARIVETRAALGGGTTPTQTMASVGIEVPGNATELHRRFLHHAIPIVGRVQEDRFVLDVRTIFEGDVSEVRAALESVHE